MAASVADDSDPEPANTTDVEDLSTGLVGAIQQSKQHLDEVCTADTDEKACSALPKLVARYNIIYFFISFYLFYLHFSYLLKKVFMRLME